MYEDKYQTVRYVLDGKKEVEHDIDINRLWEIIDQVSAERPSSSVYQVVESCLTFSKDNRKTICPTSIIDPMINKFLQWENQCEKYHVLPFAGGLLDQPSLILQIFATIRATVNQYDEYELKLAQERNSNV